MNIRNIEVVSDPDPTQEKIPRFLTHPNEITAGGEWQWPEHKAERREETQKVHVSVVKTDPSLQVPDKVHLLVSEVGFNVAKLDYPQRD